MCLRDMRWIVLALTLLGSAPARAQGVVATIPTQAATPALLGASGTAQELCDRAASTPWAVEARGFGAAMRCAVRPAPQGAAALEIDFSLGVRLYLLSSSGRVIARLQQIDAGPTEAGDVELLRLRAFRSGGRSFWAVESAGDFIDFEGEEAVGYARRSLTVCALGAPGPTCADPLPLAFESWRGEAPDGGFTPVDGHRVVDRASATASWGARAGRIRLRLRTGSWALLFGGDRFLPDDVPSGRSHTWPLPSLDPE